MSKRAELLKLLLFACLYFIAPDNATGKPSKVRREIVAIFDANDRIVKLVTVYASKKGVWSDDKDYRFIIAEPTNRGTIFHRCFNRSTNAQTVLLVAIPIADSWIAAYSWTNFRFFSRPFSCNPSIWSTLCESEVRRSASLPTSLIDTRQNNHKFDKTLWGYQLPPSSKGRYGTEIFVCQRPLWQREYSHQITTFVTNYTANTLNSIAEFVVSHPTITVSTRAEHFKVINSGQPAVRYVASVPIINKMAHFFYIPSEPIAKGDAVTMFSRDNLKSLNIKGQFDNAFISVVIRSFNQNQKNAQLMISLGGIDRFSNVSKNFSYSLTFEDGTTIHASNIDSRRSSLRPWPIQIPLNQAIIFANGSLNSENNKKIILKESSYTLIPADEVFVGGVRAYAERYTPSSITSPPNTLTGGTFRIHVR